MKHTIDIVVVIRERMMAAKLRHMVEVFIPELRLVRVRTPLAAISLIHQYKVKVLAVPMLSPDLAVIQAKFVQQRYPHTTLLLLPSLHNHCQRWLSAMLAWLSDFQCLRRTHASPRQSRSHQPNQEQRALSAMEEAVICCDKQGLITYLNSMAQQLTGLSCKEALGLPLSRVLQVGKDSTGQALTNHMEQAILRKQTEPQQLDAQLLHQGGDKTNVRNSVAPILDASGKNDGAVVVLHKMIPSQLKIQEIYHQANHDYLTDLPNRALLTERLNLAISLAIRHNKHVGLLFLDLDHFKLVNDSLGHDAGDLLLKSVSHRLSECVRTSDTVSRYGGDEFTILLTEVANCTDCEQVASKILDAFTLPHQLHSKAVVISLSIGISVYPSDARSSDMMFKHADQAMYLAKTKGRNRFEVYPYEKLSSLGQ